MPKPTDDRKAMLDELQQKVKDFEALLDLLNQRGYFPKKARVKKQVIYKTKFITRKPRTKKELPQADATMEGQTL